MATMKKSKASKESEMDRLSDLPNSLIHYILFSLNTKNAVQTCVLSKRWNHLWTCLPNLNFDSQIIQVSYFLQKICAPRPLST
ncbi:hypothetical protein CRYUN_Cryun23aG0051900 [Craigia yunnanensis]